MSLPSPNPIDDGSQFASSSSLYGYMNSREMMINYIKRLPKSEIKKLLTPVRDGLLTENTVLHMNMQNISIDYVVVPITINPGGDMINSEIEDPEHSYSMYRHDPMSSIRNREYSQRVIHDYIKDMDKHQKRALLNLVREGVLTDECFINLTSHIGPERIQVPMTKVVETMRNDESDYLQFHAKKPWLLRIAFMKHYSSANFSNQHKSDLNVRSLPAARYTMPVCLCIAALLFMTAYVIGFLCCCENNYHSNGLLTKDLDYSALYRHFCELSQFQRRIYIVKGLQFVLLWYTLILTIFAHEQDLNIYPALICVLTNGFGLLLFARIAVFFRTCRRTRNGTAIAAR
ncbi:hypothetical protein WR25_18937 [Diploscapter pachys]|uniref:Uncharacterized protein n=1 Tax=Diploscapter pachys TaxID=2018661 RepID=A0A2A2K8Y9_9BILA|nr:hypothetical protein WR25_18937 [Diploscapter pachys]